MLGHMQRWLNGKIRSSRVDMTSALSSSHPGTGRGFLGVMRADKRWMWIQQLGVEDNETQCCVNINLANLPAGQRSANGNSKAARLKKKKVAGDQQLRDRRILPRQKEMELMTQNLRELNTIVYFARAADEQVDGEYLLEGQARAEWFK